MLDLLIRCLRASYTHTCEGGDYAIQLDQGVLYLLFEWSDGREDWRNNLAFSAKVAYPQRPEEPSWRCHRGFLKVWRAMQHEVLSGVLWYLRRYDVRELICVGYSHGAALSLLATEDMSYRIGAAYPVSGYGFGCPRVLWGHLPPSVENRLSSFCTVRNIPDLVTHLPPAVLGFRHVGLTKIGEKGMYSPVDAHRAENYLAVLAREALPITQRAQVFSFGKARQGGGRITAG